MASSTESNPLPAQETTCPICFHRLPLQKSEHVYHTCCGQVICDGCVIGKMRTQLKEPQPQFKELGRIIEGTTPEEEQFRLIKKYGNHIYVCPYCRAPFPEDWEEGLQRLYDRIEVRDDRDYTIAVNQLGSYYSSGEHGLPQNLKKAEELFTKAYDLGNPDAAWHLYLLYHNYYPNQNEKEKKYLVRGEMIGNMECTSVLAKLACDSGNGEECARLCMKAALLGEDTSNLLQCYRHNLLSKDDLATTLRAIQAVKDEVTTKRRDFAHRFKEFCERIGITNQY